MDTKAVTRQVLLLAILAVAAVAAILWSGQEGADSSGDTASGVPIHVIVIAHSGADTILQQDVRTTGALSALRALEAAAGAVHVPMAVRQYDFGSLVVSIGGITSGDDGDWTYDVNGEFMPVGAGACMLSEGDTLSFRFGTKHAGDSAGT